MRWFRHFNDLRRDPGLQAAEQKLGEVATARAIKIFEIAAQLGSSGDRFDPRIHLQRPPTSREWLARELGISVTALTKTLKVFSKFGVIEARAWKSGVVYVPQLLDWTDEWTARKSGVTPEKLRRHSGVTREPLGKETETETVRGQRSDAEAEKSKSLPLASASSEAKETPSTKRKTSLIGVN
jgi:hypothetical protein